MEDDVSRLTSMEVEASKEIHASFHYRWEWTSFRYLSIAASTNIFRASFDELPSTPTYFHLLPRVSNFQLLPQD